MEEHDNSVLSGVKPSLILFAILGALGVICCGFAAAVLIQKNANDQQETREWIQEIAEFKYPPSAVIRDASFMGMQGWTANTSFSMLPSELNQFIQSTPIEPPLMHTGLPRGICIYELDNNAPHLFGEYHEDRGPNGYLRLSIFIDITNPNLYNVYLCAAGD